MRFQPVIGFIPNAFLVSDFAHALERPAAGAVSLILAALVLGTEIGGFQKRAVSAIMASVKRDLTGVLKKMKELLQGFFPVYGPVKSFQEMMQG